MRQKTPKEKTILAVSLINALTNCALAILKVIIGFFGFSQALVADGVHSFSDVISDALVYFAANASTRDPDAEHPYGHERIETIGTMVVAVVLLIVAFSIGYEAILRLTTHTHPKPTLAVIITAILSIIINEGLFYYNLKQGKKINSNLLISNAWHKRSDVFVSLIVLLSVIGAMSGLYWLDPVGALIITLLILKVGIEMLWQSGQELIDRAVNPDTLIAIKNTIASVPGVCSIHQLRTRLHGVSIFVDLHIIVDPLISVSEGHHIGDLVHLALLNTIKNMRDVVVHIDPENDETSQPSINLPNRKLLQETLEDHWKDLPHFHDIKKMNLHYLSGKLTIELIITANPSEKNLLPLYQNAISDLTFITRLEIYYA
ncbi:MAG: cation diffusion facilitator family transporter [Coxiellaceae bacterium]|nr:cation diffusion facilitator family transporter [Coxiellaceae bacterium]